MKSKTFIFVGRSGCGKGTQLDLLREYLSNTKSIVMGDIYRDFFKKEGYIQDIARDITTNQGKFQPDFLTNALFVNHAIEIIDGKSFLFIDGYPRTVSQLKVVKDLMDYIGCKDLIVINIEVSAESVKKRMLLRNRSDDSEKAIDSRLSEYERTVVPMIEKIKSDTSLKYIEINGEPAVKEIHQDILSKLNI